MGHRSALLSIRDVWRLTLSPTVILLTLMIGMIVALTMTFSHLTAGDQTFYYQLPFILVPTAVTIVSSSLLTASYYLKHRHRVRHGKAVGVVTVPVTFVALFACTPFLFIFNWMKYIAGGLSFEAMIMIMLICPIIYVIISDYIHYMIIRYLSADLLGREMVHPPATEAEGSPHGLSSVLGWFLSPPTHKPKADADAPQLSWSNTICLSIWTSGHRSSLMSVRELWGIVFSPLVIALSILIGSSAGVASTITLRAVGDSTYMYLMLFSVAPVLVNIGSASLMSVYVFLRIPRDPERQPPVITVPSVLTIYLVALPTIMSIYLLKIAGGGLGEEWLIYVIGVTPLAYVVISDFFHYVVFSFIAPSIWGRAHIYQTSPASGTVPEKEVIQKAPRLVSTVPEIPRAQRDVVIGNLSLTESALIFLEAQGNYLRVVTKAMDQLERYRISSAVEQLSDGLGIYVHRSYWVAFSGIENVSLADGQCRIHTINDAVINVASTRQKDVLRELSDRGIIDAPRARAQ